MRDRWSCRRGRNRCRALHLKNRRALRVPSTGAVPDGCPTGYRSAEARPRRLVPRGTACRRSPGRGETLEWSLSPTYAAVATRRRRRASRTDLGGGVELNDTGKTNSRCRRRGCASRPQAPTPTSVRATAASRATVYMCRPASDTLSAPELVRAAQHLFDGVHQRSGETLPSPVLPHRHAFDVPAAQGGVEYSSLRCTTAACAISAP